MIEDDKQNFRKMLGVVMQTYDKPKPDRDLLIVWWSKLNRFEFETVRAAFDQWIDSSKYAPTPMEIMELCKPKVTIHARIASPLNIEANKRHADELMATVNKLVSPERDHKAWARKILANPKGRPEIAIRFAREAING